jgi:methionyl-tRNA formyltransferase
MKIVFMGSADFGIPTLEILAQSHKIVAVVSTPARPKGRGLKVEESPVVQFAQKNGIGPVLTPEKLSDESFIEQLKSFNADIFVVVAFRILPRSVFSIPPLGTVNIHASLLPKYRGPAPIHRAIEAGERESGITIFRIDDGIDTGEIITQITIPIGEQQTTPELYEIMSRCGAENIVHALELLQKGEIVPFAQNHLAACKAPKLKKDEGLIDWNLSAETIFNKIRAFKPFPGTYAQFSGQRLGIEWAIPVLDRGNDAGISPGTIVEISSDTIIVKCGTGSLQIQSVKPEGKRNMTVHDFLLGTRILKGTKFS